MNERYTLKKEMFIIFIGAVLVAIITAHLDLFEVIHDFAIAHEKWEIDELFVLSIYFSLAFSLFSFRRWKDALKEIQNRKKLEQDLLKSKNEADQAKTSMGKFLVDMSHELRTPLNAIIGFSDILFDGMVGELNEKQKDYVYTISKSGTHLLHLINQLLDLAKIESGKLELNIEEFELQDLFDEVSAIIAALAKKKSIIISYEVTPDLGLLNADRLKIKQILFNLVSNAIKFTSEKGTVSIMAEKIRDNTMLLKVSDNGSGMSPDDMKKIFRPFEQLGNMEDSGYKGTGLGLSIVQDLVSLHKGKVWVESEPGKGSVFLVELPVSVNEVYWRRK
ncbi:signal transduction histidine kinase [Methanolobus tindarius DSM 2278]|uniref:histidine kinase n=1 Tax=Methanolobus tindarius DSM 2278 TaxID=1090322 RepID=W9DNX7_METTI|nr:HAMP domain-containing sensor histidine kinase [Methanolobus tindarius]ETA66763.1 signal transduction histidine kinase [Methanolobus tindarius DSM 2278]